MSTNEQHSSLELVCSIECSCSFNSGKRKRCLLKLVKVSARDVVRRSSHAGVATLTAVAARKMSTPYIPFVACGANLEVYECNFMGKKKQQVFNLRKMESAKFGEGSAEESSKKRNNYVLKIKFTDSELCLYLEESKRKDGEKFADFLEDLKRDCNNFFSWVANPQFTVNAAYTGSYEVTVVSNLPGVDSAETFEMKILLECILLLRHMKADSSAEVSDAVVKFWPIMSIKNYGCHANDNHLFAIEYAVTDSETLDLSECVFRSPYARVLVKNLKGRIDELRKVQPEHVYTEVDRTNRISILADMKKNKMLNGNANNDDISEKSGVSSSSDIKPPSRNYDPLTEEQGFMSNKSNSSFSNNNTDFYDGPLEENSGGLVRRDDGPIYHVVDSEAEKRDTSAGLAAAMPRSNYPPSFAEDNCYYSVDLVNPNWENKMKNAESAKEPPEIPLSVPVPSTHIGKFNTSSHAEIVKLLETSFKTPPPSPGGPLKPGKREKSCDRKSGNGKDQGTTGSKIKVRSDKSAVLV